MSSRHQLVRAEWVTSLASALANAPLIIRWGPKARPMFCAIAIVVRTAATSGRHYGVSGDRAGPRRFQRSPNDVRAGEFLYVPRITSVLHAVPFVTA